MVTGGSASGKSEFAENLCISLASSKKIAPLFYLASLDRESGGDTLLRIKRHREERKNKGFVTLELPRIPENFSLPPSSIALLEDLGNLTANIIFNPLYLPKKSERTFKTFTEIVSQNLSRVFSQASDAVVVTNDVFLSSDFLPQSRSPELELYIQVLAAVNNNVASASDQTYRVIAGIPLPLKK